MLELSDLTSLRTLVLHKEDLWSSPNITRDEKARDQVIDISCERCPRLTHIIHKLTGNWYAGQHCYTKLLISRDNSHVLNVRREDVVVYRTHFNSWWEIYDHGF